MAISGSSLSRGWYCPELLPEAPHVDALPLLDYLALEDARDIALFSSIDMTVTSIGSEQRGSPVLADETLRNESDVHLAQLVLLQSQERAPVPDLVLVDVWPAIERAGSVEVR